LNLGNIATRAAGTGKLWANQNAPAIMTVTGAAGMIVTVALAIRQTAKACEKNGVFEDVTADLQIARLAKEEAGSDLSDREKNQQLARVYVQSAAKLAKVYWPVFSIGTISLGLMLQAHNIQQRRYSTLVTAYTALDTAFRAYRRRVADEVGEEHEKEIYLNAYRRTLEPNEAEGRLEACEVWDPADMQAEPSLYSRFFDSSSNNWTKTPEYNLTFLKAQQTFANQKLQANGYVFLNEIYEALGIPRSQAGQLVGWKLGHPNSDGYISFGIHDIFDERQSFRQWL
jgi:hypothetical protein